MCIRQLFQDRFVGSRVCGLTLLIRVSGQE
jgi:hypothetical protein